MKKIFVLMLSFVATVVFTLGAAAAEKISAATQTKAGQASQKAAAAKTAGAMKSSFLMMLGTVSKIDTANPSSVKIEVKDSRDGQIHVLEVTPATNITKITDISEIKAGDSVRVMARRADNKETAMGIMFGNFKTQPPPQAAPQAKAAPKK